MGADYRLGFNVIAHLNSNSGLGNAARLFIDVLKSAGIGVAGFNVEYAVGESRRSLDGIDVCERIEDLPYDLNVVIVAIQLLPSLWLRRAPGLANPRFKNAGLLFWELAAIPEAWRPSLSMFDVILACSPFVQQAIENSLPEIPTLLVEHPLLRGFTPRPAAEVRRTWNLPSSNFVCASSFDLRSDIARKNPQATFEAFRTAFQDDSDVTLMIKTNKIIRDALPGAARNLLEDLEKDPRVVLISETLPYEEVLSLYAAADVYVSLHRAEGLGLGPMEAMLLGKCAISTGYSGNMAYMNGVNSFPVPYTLVEPQGTVWQYLRSFSGKRVCWADADVAEAAKALRWAKEFPDEREFLAVRGRRDVIERQEDAWSGKYAVRLIHLLRRSVRWKERDRCKGAIRRAEVLNPILRKHNMHAFWQKLSSTN